MYGMDVQLSTCSDCARKRGRERGRERVKLGGLLEISFSERNPDFACSVWSLVVLPFFFSLSEEGRDREKIVAKMNAPMDCLRKFYVWWGN